MKKIYFLILLIFVSWFAALQPAWATTLAGTSLLEMLDNAEHIVIAEVENVARRFRYKFAKRAELVVTETIRGDASAGDVIPLPFTSLIPFGFSGWPMRIEYHSGEIYILFLKENPEGSLMLYSWDGRILVTGRDGPKVSSLRELLKIKGMNDERRRVAYVLKMLLESSDFAYPYYIAALIANVQDPDVLSDKETREVLRHLLTRGDLNRFLLSFLHSVWREDMFIELADLFTGVESGIAYRVAYGIASEMRGFYCVGRDDCEATIEAFLAGLEGVEDSHVYSRLVEQLQLLISVGDFSLEAAEKKFLPILVKRIKESPDRSIRLTSLRALRSFHSRGGEDLLRMLIDELNDERPAPVGNTPEPASIP